MPLLSIQNQPRLVFLGLIQGNYLLVSSLDELFN